MRLRGCAVGLLHHCRMLGTVSDWQVKVAPMHLASGMSKWTSTWKWEAVLCAMAVDGTCLNTQGRATLALFLKSIPALPTTLALRRRGAAASRNEEAGLRTLIDIVGSSPVGSTYPVCWAALRLGLRVLLLLRLGLRLLLLWARVCPQNAKTSRATGSASSPAKEFSSETRGCA